MSLSTSAWSLEKQLWILFVNVLLETKVLSVVGVYYIVNFSLGRLNIKFLSLANSERKTYEPRFLLV
jgi:hypothetical protein